MFDLRLVLVLLWSVIAKVMAEQPSKKFGSVVCRCRRGFTLIEIMIVVGLIGLLAIIAIPSFIRSRANSYKQVCLNNLRQINGAIEIWALEYNKTEDSPVAWPDISKYIKSEPVCPAGGTNFDTSYSITTASEKASCQRLPAEHHF